MEGISQSARQTENKRKRKVLELTDLWVFHVVRILGVGVDSLYPLQEKRLSRSERK